MIRSAPRRAPRDSTIALINIVFLMLIFFLIAGSLAPPMARDMSLVSVADLDGRDPPDALLIHADGRLSYRGSPITPAGYAAEMAGDTALRIVPDRDSEAAVMVAVAGALRAAGADRVLVVSERALP